MSARDDVLMLMRAAVALQRSAPVQVQNATEEREEAFADPVPYHAQPSKGQSAVPAHRGPSAGAKDETHLDPVPYFKRSNK